MELGFCRYCGKQVKWIKTERGKNMPCEPMPRGYIETPGGKDKIVTPEGEVLSCEYVPLKADTPHGFVPHWGECAGDGLRKRQKERGDS